MFLQIHRSDVSHRPGRSVLRSVSLPSAVRTAPFHGRQVVRLFLALGRALYRRIAPGVRLHRRVERPRGHRARVHCLLRARVFERVNPWGARSEDFPPGISRPRRGKRNPGPSSAGDGAAEAEGPPGCQRMDGMELVSRRTGVLPHGRGGIQTPRRKLLLEPTPAPPWEDQGSRNARIRDGDRNAPLVDPRQWTQVKHRVNRDSDQRHRVGRETLDDAIAVKTSPSRRARVLDSGSERTRGLEILVQAKKP